MLPVTLFGVGVNHFENFISDSTPVYLFEEIFVFYHVVVVTMVLEIAIRRPTIRENLRFWQYVTLNDF